jgi:hypothetical protein
VRTAAALAVVATVLGSTAASAAAPEPARFQVSATEFRLTLSRSSVPSGPVIVELYNRGEDDHDLALRRIGKGAVTRRIGIVHPGRVAELETRLSAGTFVLWCTLADHRVRGMRARLVVRAR